MEPQALISELRPRLKREGLFEPDPVGVMGQLCAHIAAMVAGALLFFTAEHPLIAAFGLALGGYGGTGSATNVHTACHGAASRSRWVNHAICLVGFPLMTGLSARFWKDNHAAHHRAPNHLNHDPDIDVEPLFCLSAERIARSGPLRRAWYRHGQWLMLPPLASGMALSLIAQGARYRVQKGLSGAFERLDALAMLAHFGLLIGIPGLIWGWDVAALHWGGRALFLGLGIFFTVTPGHWNASARLTEAPPSAHGFVLRQAMTTVDFRANPLVRWVCSGLELHVEHHLFPEIPHTRLRQASPLIREGLAGAGVSVHEVSWSRACLEIIEGLRHTRRAGGLEPEASR